MGNLCPLLQKKCIENRCLWYIQLQGTNKNTGQAIDNWGCAMAWLPILLIENATETRQAAAAIESLRNVTVMGEDATRAAMMEGMAQIRLEDRHGEP